MWGLEIQMRRFVPEEKSELANEGFQMSKGMGDLLNRYNFEVNLNMVVSLSLCICQPLKCFLFYSFLYTSSLYFAH
jgi:hypothetical protein